MLPESWLRQLAAGMEVASLVVGSARTQLHAMQQQASERAHEGTSTRAAAAAAAAAGGSASSGDAAAQALFRHLDQNGDGRIRWALGE